MRNNPFLTLRKSHRVSREHKPLWNVFTIQTTSVRQGDRLSVILKKKEKLY